MPFLIFSSYTSQEPPIRVAVAANAQFAMKELEKQYEKETGEQIELIMGSSGKLTAQIREGAPYDIFLSADMEYPETLHKEGLTLSTPKIYGYGTLVLWTMKDLDLSSPNVLTSPEIKTIAIANPKVAPYGEAAVDVLNFYKIYEKTKNKLVYGESISQVTQYLISQSADIGFTAKSVILSPEMKGKGKWIEVDKKAYKPIAQGAVLLQSSAKRNKAGSEKFYKYIYSEKAKKIFGRYGYDISE